MPSIPQFGVHRDRANSRVALNYAGTRRASVNANGLAVNGTATVSSTLAVTGAQTATGLITATAGVTVGPTGAGVFSLGTAETVTLVSGVATVTRPLVILDAEGAGTTDTLDSIVKSGQTAGELLLVLVNATDTITADNSSTLLLGAATRAIAPGGSLLLLATSATVWTEIAFLTATS